MAETRGRPVIATPARSVAISFGDMQPMTERVKSPNDRVELRVIRNGRENARGTIPPTGTVPLYPMSGAARSPVRSARTSLSCPLILFRRARLGQLEEEPGLGSLPADDLEAGLRRQFLEVRQAHLRRPE